MLRIIICLMFERPLQRYSVPLRLYQQEYCTWENTLCVVAVPVHADGPTDFYSVHLKTSYLRHGLVQDESKACLAWLFMIDLPHGTKNISYISQDGESEYSVQIL
jgi:hypothetical protein